MSWDYRVMRRQETDNTFSFGIYEVYYDDLCSWTEEHIGPLGDTLEDLKKELAFMQAALARPVLDYDTGKEIKP